MTSAQEIEPVIFFSLVDCFKPDLREKLIMLTGEKKKKKKNTILWAQLKEGVPVECLRGKCFSLQNILRPKPLNLLWPQYVPGLFDIIF